MSTTVKYKGQILDTFTDITRTLKTKGRWLEDHIEITDSLDGTLGYIYEDTSGNIYFSETIPDASALNIRTVLVLGEINIDALVDYDNDPFVDSSGNTFVAVSNV